MIHIPVDLFNLVAPALKKVNYAVGGATAMAAAGYVRQTEDVDVFFNHKDTRAVLRALHSEGVRFATLMEFPDEARGTVGKRVVPINVFPAVLLQAAKVRSDRVKDHHDVFQMDARGLDGREGALGAGMRDYYDPDDGLESWEPQWKPPDTSAWTSADGRRMGPPGEGGGDLPRGASA